MASGFTFAISIFAASLCGILALVSGATFNLVNRCSYDVWPAISTNGGSQQQESSIAPFGISPNSSNTLHLPDTWSGQIWGRTGCSFDSSSGINRCEIGECGSGFQCLVDGRTLSVTLAEFTIGGFNNLSFYDISLVGGFNLPLSVSPSQKSASKNSSSFTCGSPSCTADVIQHCPPQLRVSNKSKILACSSACNAFQTDKYCCTGNFSSPSECVPTNYSRTFKNLCPFVYTYPFDDATSTFTCPDSDFTLTFCSDNSFQSATLPLSPIPVITPSQSPGHGSRSPTIGQKPQPSGPSTHVGLIVRVCLGAIAIVGVGFVCLVWLWRYWKKDREAKIPGIGPRKFKYKELYSATKGFSPSELLGEGAHGQVYKGTLRASGSLVAVKKVAAEKGGRGMRELVSELNIISMLRHRNLTQLQGWCENKGEVLVVYDYMPNGSLDKVLFAHNGFVLDWQSRYGIVCGLATALLYLHDEGEKRVVHRDVKPSNIMLDANFEAKLGDFGLARLIDRDVTPRSSVVAGTFGYLAPEIATTRHPTAESDVFSFGIVALEVACGRQSFHLASESGSFFLLDKVRNLSKEGKIMEAADPRLAGNFDVEEMERLFYVGLAATDPNPNERPTMREVLNILTREAPAALNTEEVY